MPDHDRQNSRARLVNYDVASGTFGLTVIENGHLINSVKQRPNWLPLSGQGSVLFGRG